MPGGMEKIGLIAGNGRFPVLFAQTARQAGVSVVAIAHEGETEVDLSEHVDTIVWVKVGKLDSIVRALREHRVQRAVMAGGIQKAALMDHFEPDERGLRMLSGLASFSDDAVLRAVAAELEAEGLQVVESTLFLDSILAGEGVLAGPEPDEAAWRDVRLGVSVARGIGRWDIGQSVVLKSGIVLAVEALEGTDATLRRGGTLGRGCAVAVKVSKPGQDLRFDVPAVGPQTVTVCEESGIAVLALEAGKTVLLERAEFLARAAAVQLSVVGVRADA